MCQVSEKGGRMPTHAGILDGPSSFYGMPPRTRALRLVAPIVATGVMAAVCVTEAVVAQAEPPATPSGEVVSEVETATLTVSTAAEPPLGPDETLDLTVTQGATGRVESKAIGQGQTWILSDLEPGGLDLRRNGAPPGYTVDGIRCVSGDTVVRDVAGDVVVLPLSLADGDVVACTFGLVRPSATAGGGATRLDEASTPEPEPTVTQSPTPRANEPLLVPREGRWRSKNRKGQVSCGRLRRTLDASGPKRGTITVRRGGDRIILRGLAGDSPQPIRADRDPDKSDRYVGTLRFELGPDGITADFRFILDLESPERIEGRMVGKAKVAGQPCTIRQSFVVTYAP